MNRLWCRLLFLFLLLGGVPVMGQDEAAQAPRPSIGLALGSGGAGGLAHIAMLQVFDDLAIRPDRIVGTSIGAVIGALYASGLSAEEIREIFAEFGGSNLDVLSRLVLTDSELSLAALLKLDLDNGGLLDSSGFLAFLAGKIEARTFADLLTPLEVVATDYLTGEMVVLDRGDLFDAIAASMAVPGLFSPERHGDRLLIDGGTSNPLPFDRLQERHDLVIAIDVTGPRTPREVAEVELLDLLFNSFKIMQQSIIAARMRASEPDIYIRPDTSGIRLLHFNRIEAILQQAEPAAQALRAQLQAALGQSPE